MPRRSEDRVWVEDRLARMPLLRATYLHHQFSTHTHDNYVIGANVSGAAVCTDECDLVLSPGMLGVVPPGVPHGGRRAGVDPWDYRAVYPSAAFMTGLFRDIVDRENAEPALAHSFFLDHDLHREFLRAHRALRCTHDPLEGEVRMTDVLSTVLLRYGRNGRSSRRIGREHRGVTRAIEFIDTHLDAPLSLSRIAESAGLSRYHFLRVFSRETHLTPHAFVMRRRVERARALLRAGLPIAEAAGQAGFADQSHLSRRFKEYVGVTPGEYVRGLAH